MRKPVVAMAAGASVFTLVAAGAATLSATGYVPQSTSITDSCQVGAVDVDTTVGIVQVPYDGGGFDNYTAVTEVTVTGLDALCLNQELGVNLETVSADQSRPFIASASTTITGATATVTFIASPPTVDDYETIVDPVDVSAVYVTIAGNVVFDQPV